MGGLRGGWSAARAADALGAYINKLSGVTRLEELKAAVVVSSGELKTARAALKLRREEYHAMVDERALAQTTSTDLLQSGLRSDADFVAFRKAWDAGQEASTKLNKSIDEIKVLEVKVDELQKLLDDTLHERYVQEVIMSGRNRRISNILSCFLVVANLGTLAFSQLVIEPWRIGKYTHGVESMISQANVPIHQDLQSIAAALASLNDEMKRQQVDMKTVDKHTTPQNEEQEEEELNDRSTTQQHEQQESTMTMTNNNLVVTSIFIIGSMIITGCIQIISKVV